MTSMSEEAASRTCADLDKVSGWNHDGSSAFLGRTHSVHALISDETSAGCSSGGS